MFFYLWMNEAVILSPSVLIGAKNLARRTEMQILHPQGRVQDDGGVVIINWLRCYVTSEME